MNTEHPDSDPARDRPPTAAPEPAYRRPTTLVACLAAATVLLVGAGGACLATGGGPDVRTSGPAAPARTPRRSPWTAGPAPAPAPAVSRPASPTRPAPGTWPPTDCRTGPARRRCTGRGPRSAGSGWRGWHGRSAWTGLRWPRGGPGGSAAGTAPDRP
ncbi:hypothetical protein ACFQ3Z_14070 [Streptomyces nogalater]